jgi:hypothetical protein
MGNEKWQVENGKSITLEWHTKREYVVTSDTLQPSRASGPVTLE